MESENNKDQQQNVSVGFRNELINQEKFLKAAKRFLEQEMLCLQIDEMKLRARLRRAQVKVENKESDDEYKEEVASNVREGNNSNLVSSPNPHAIKIKEEPVDTEETSASCAGSSQSLKTQSNSASNARGCQLRSGASGSIVSPSGFEDYPCTPGDLQIMESEDED